MTTDRRSRVLALGLAGLAVSLVTLAGSFAPASSGATACSFYASPSGSDNDPGTATQPFRTVQQLVDRLASGETGCLYGGAYTTTLVKLQQPNVTLRSADGERASIAGSIWVTNTANGVTLAGFDLDGSSSSNAWALLVHGDDVTLYGLDVTNPKTGYGQTNAICILAGEGFETNAANTAYRLTVDHVRAHDCGDDGHEHGIYMESTRDAHIVDSWFYDNPGMGIDFYPDAQGTHVDRVVLNSNSGDCKSNLVFSGERAGGEYSQNHASSNNVVEHSLITNARCRYNVDSFFPASSPLPVGNEVRFSCVWNAPYGNYGQGTDILGYSEHDNLDADPLYVDAAREDFHLQAGSPCAGWGPSSDGAPAPAPDFGVSVAPDPATASQGGTAFETVSVDSLSGFSSDVDLAVSGVPNATAVSLASSTVAAGTSTLLSLSPSASTPAGAYDVTVTGNSGGRSRSAKFTLTVAPAGSFTLSASPTRASVVRGKSASFTLTVQPENGFSGPVALAVAKVPPGTTTSFGKNPLDGSATASTALSLKTTASTPAGTYSVVVTASGGGLTRSASLTLRVKRR
jgi:hypothetical protein